MVPAVCTQDPANTLERERDMTFRIKHKAIATATSVAMAAGAMAHAEDIRVVTDPSFVSFKMMDRETGEKIGYDMDITRDDRHQDRIDWQAAPLSCPGKWS